MNHQKLTKNQRVTKKELESSDEERDADSNGVLEAFIIR